MVRIITIARGMGSGGRAIGKMLSEDLNIKYYDKDLIKLASEKSGINERFFGLVDEKLKGSFIRRGGVYKGDLLSPDDPDFTSDQNLFNFSASVINELAEKEGVTEALKADNAMEWVRKMNNIRSRAKEIVDTEVIYN